ncbi:MAG: Tex family protein [Bacteroidia bacterium]
MNHRHVAIIARELGLPSRQVTATLHLLADGATVPFISRYRKEATGSLDEVQVASIRDRAAALEAMDKRREAMLASLEERNLLTDDIRKKLEAAETLTQLEDAYLPWRPKRRTRATMAREKGLEPLANLIFRQDPRTDPFAEAAAFIDQEKEVNDAEEALQGARDIIAEMAAEDSIVRERMRSLYEKKSVIFAKVIKGKEEEGQKYRDYFSFSEPLRKIPSHRLLALRRGEKDGILRLKIEPEEAEAINLMASRFVKNNSPAAKEVLAAVTDGYKRLLGSSMETEARLWSKEDADLQAIKVFAENAKNLLLAAPLGQKRVLAIDPGFRTGCKVVCLGAQGQLRHYTAIFPHPPQNQAARAEAELLALVEDYDIEVIAIGNATAGRETRIFVNSIDFPQKPKIFMVNESGASIYSASEVAREEFPDHDVTVRGAVSIGRRLMDPMAELVKIDPKSIGVGQYQHDVDQNLLKKSLDDTVMFSVNSVGVALNTASKQLLMYVSGLGPSLAQQIVNYRNEHGPFNTRKELLAVPKLGPKAFEQAAGFLRIRHGAHPLDATGIHPERYELVEQMAADLGVEVQDLIDKPELRKRIQLANYISDSVGEPTLLDIMEEFENEGFDPREDMEDLVDETSSEEGGDENVAVDVSSISDLEEGIWVHGTVTNVADFGAFVDIGVGQDGLIHISQLASRFVKHPSEIVKPGDSVKARVLNVDEGRGRISLSLKQEGEEEDRPRGGGGRGRGGDRRGGGGGGFGERRGGSGGGYGDRRGGGGGGGYGERRGGGGSGGGYGERRSGGGGGGGGSYGGRRGGSGGGGEYGERRGGGGGRRRFNDGDDYRPRRRDDDYDDRF